MNELKKTKEKNIEDLRAEIQELVQSATRNVLEDVHQLLRGTSSR